MPYDWTKLIEPAAQIGGSLLGDALQNKQSQAGINENKRQFDITQGNQQAVNAKRAQNAGIMSPTMLWALGYRDKDQIAQLSKQIGTPPGGATPGLGGGAPSYSAVPAGSSGLSKGIGIGGALGGLGAGAAFGGPIGAAVAGGGMLGSLVANKIGAGHRQANSFVQGVENPFGQQDLAKVVKQRDAGDVEGAKQTFTAALAAYRNAVNTEMSAGGNRAKVAQQSLNNPQLKQTIEQIAQSLGVQL